jgi:hypothetical protein
VSKPLKISEHVADKLLHKHGVTRGEVFECFLNREGPTFLDTRADHQTDPPTAWFVAETDRRRVLKVVFIEYPEFYAIKTVFEPADGSDRLYYRLCAKYADR